MALLSCKPDFSLCELIDEYFTKNHEHIVDVFGYSLRSGVASELKKYEEINLSEAMTDIGLGYSQLEEI